MFAISVRVRPWSARSSPRSVGRVTVIVPSSCCTFIRCGITWSSSPSGPLTCTRPGEIATATPVGTSIGLFPMRLIGSPDEADDFAVDAGLGGLAGGHQPVRGREDRDTHAAEHARQAVLARIDAAPGLRDALEVGEHTLTTAAVLELDHEVVERLAALDAVVGDVALLLQEPGDLDLELRGRHRRRVVQRLVGVADAREHVCDWIGQHCVSPTNCSRSYPG